MNEYKTIEVCSLDTYDSDDSQLTTKDLYYPWYNSGKFIFISINVISRDDKLIEDLLTMADQGVDGYLVVKSEDGIYTKLLLMPESADINIKAFRGSITYRDKPYKTFRKEKEVKAKENDK